MAGAPGAIATSIVLKQTGIPDSLRTMTNSKNGWAPLAINDTQNLIDVYQRVPFNATGIREWILK